MSTRTPKVSIAALGGTITMASPEAGAGVVPTLTAESLVGGLPQLADIATISATTLSKLPGASLTPRATLDAVAWAASEVANGASGVVIAQGTDTLEETAYLADLYWDRDEPLVFTGAMRSPHQPSADGPANLIASCRVAAEERCRGAGVLVVLNDELHAAATVRKQHSTALSAFASPGEGRVGSLIEGKVHLHRNQRVRPPRMPEPVGDPYVPLLETYLGDDGRALRTAREAGADGVVIAAFGAGHVSMALAEEIERSVSDIPVVVSSRTGAGGTLSRTYGFVGSEMDLSKRGAVLSGRLDQRKSRVLLWALLASGAATEGVAERFARLVGDAPGGNGERWT